MKSKNVFILFTLMAFIFCIGCLPPGETDNTKAKAPIIRGALSQPRKEPIDLTADQVWVIPIFVTDESDWRVGVDFSSLYMGKAVDIADDGTFAFSYGTQEQTDGITHIPAFTGTTFTGQVSMLMVNSDKLSSTSLETRKEGLLGIISVNVNDDTGKALFGMPFANLKSDADVDLGEVDITAGEDEVTASKDIGEIATHFTLSEEVLTAMAYNDDAIKTILNWIINLNVNSTEAGELKYIDENSKIYSFHHLTYSWTYKEALKCNYVFDNTSTTYWLDNSDDNGNFAWIPSVPNILALDYRGFDFSIETTVAGLPTGVDAALYDSKIEITQPESVLLGAPGLTPDEVVTKATSSPFKNDGAADGNDGMIPASIKGLAGIFDYDMGISYGNESGQTAWRINLGVSYDDMWAKREFVKSDTHSYLVENPYAGRWAQNWFIRPASGMAITTGWWDMKVDSTTVASFNLDAYDPYNGAETATSGMVYGIIPSLEVTFREVDAAGITMFGMAYSNTVKKVKFIETVKAEWYYFNGTTYVKAPEDVVRLLVREAKINIEVVGTDTQVSHDISNTGVTVSTFEKPLFLGPFRNFYELSGPGVSSFANVTSGDDERYGIHNIYIGYAFNGVEMRFNFNAFDMVGVVDPM